MNYQTALISPTTINQRTISIDNIKATFVGKEENKYDIILEINSNKFLIAMEAIADQIEQFEIVAIKWFIELSNKIITMVKKLIEHLRYRLD